MIKNILLSSVLKNQFSNSHVNHRIFEINLINSTSQLNVKRNSRVLRRRITRLETDYEIGEEEIEKNKLSDYDRPVQRIRSKNPRNLEQLLFEQKPLGWELDAKNKSFWNKIEFNKKGKYINAKVVHHTGKTLIEVSETDDSLKDILIGKDSLAVTNLIGQIIARRCFESGIQYVHCDFDTEDESTSKKLIIFIDSLKSNGLILQEPEFLVARRANKDL